MSMQTILKAKGSMVLTVHVDGILADAMRVMTEKNVGALVVVDDGGNIQGIVSERDVMRAAYNTQSNCKGLAIKQAMTPKEKLIIGQDSDAIDYAMNVMTENRIRHLPILNDQGKLVGMVSLGDVVKARLSDSEYEIKHLMDYIGDCYPV